LTVAKENVGPGMKYRANSTDPAIESVHESRRWRMRALSACLGAPVCAGSRTGLWSTTDARTGRAHRVNPSRECAAGLAGHPDHPHRQPGPYPAALCPARRPGQVSAAGAGGTLSEATPAASTPLGATSQDTLFRSRQPLAQLGTGTATETDTTTCTAAL